MLLNLKIIRFKSIYEQELKFGRANLFVGANGSGKSNILEALGVLSAALSGGLDPTTLDLRGVRLSLPHLFKSAFKNYAFPKTFRLEATFENGRYECSIRSGLNSPLEFFSESLYDGKKQVFGRGPHGTKLHSIRKQLPHFNKDLVPSNRSVWSVIEPIAEISAGLRDELDEFARYAIYNPQTAIMRGMATDHRVVEPLGLTGSGLASALTNVMNNRTEDFPYLTNIIWEPGWADQVQTGGYNPEIVPAQVRSEGSLLYIRDRFMRSERNMLSAFDASEGTLYLIFVATLLAHSKTPNVFGLDNVDGTLNPRLVRKLSEHLIDVVCNADSITKRQVFMTSHHPSSLDSFDIFNENQKIFVCSRNRNPQNTVVGATLFENLVPPVDMSREDWLLAHRGRNLSELLLTDRIPSAL